MTPLDTTPRGKRGGARRIGGLAAAAGRRAFARRGFREALVLSEWDAIVGAEFAARCAPESLRRGVLTLRTDGATALLLRHVEPQLRERIAAYFGHSAVSRFAYRHDPPPPRPAAPEPPPRAPEPPREAAAALAAIDDAALRGALTALGRRVAGANRARLRRRAAGPI